MLRCLTVALALSISLSAVAAEKIVAKLTLQRSAGDLPNIELQLTRARGADGSLTIKLVAKGVGERTQTLVIYEGGGDDDGFGDDDLRAVKLAELELPGGQKGARVDLVHHIADGKKSDERTDTTLVGLGGNKVHKALELVTRTARDRSKVCRELEETSIAIAGDKLTATTQLKRDPALDDDDLPIDKTCRSPSGSVKKVYGWAEERFADEKDEAEGDD